MPDVNRPSKQFLVRGGIALGIVVVILVVQTKWFHNLFHKKPKESIVAPQTVGDIVSTDTNKNGVPDWEEKLWGLDPTALYTNGVPNKQIIEDKKKALGLTNTTSNTDAQPKNETDAFAQQLLTITAALSTSGKVSDADIQSIATKIAQSIDFQKDAEHYSLKDVQTVQTTTASLNTYYNAVSAVAAKYNTDVADIDVVINALENGDPSQLPQLANTKTWYQQYAKALLAVPTPVGIEGYHLQMVNSVYGISLALGYLSQLEDNGTNALAGVALYKIYDQSLSQALTNIKDYLTRYGILSSSQ